MAPHTPRKGRNRNHPRASDYESDAAQAGPSSRTPRAQQAQAQAHAVAAAAQAATGVPIPQPQSRPDNDALVRSIAALNLRVLQRHMPAVQSYDRLAFSGSVYEHQNDAWIQHKILGALFVCDMPPYISNATGQLTPSCCVFVMNRQGLDNFTLDLATVMECELEDSIIMLEAIDASGNTKTWGIHVTAEAIQAAYAMIHERWKAARGVGAQQ